MHFETRRGTPVLALERARDLDLIAITAGIENEIFRVLTAKFGWDESAAQQRLNYLLANSLHVPIMGTLHVCRDPNDDMVLECAVRANAQTIVAGDKDLLTLGSYEGVRIVTPAGYLALNG